MLKRKFHVLAGVISLSLGAPALAQSAPAKLPDADPALWVVKDKDTTIYLFGTFHLLDGKQDWFNDEVKTAFDASQELVLEAKMPENPADLQPLVIKYAIDPAGKTLSSKLPAATMEKVGKELSAVGVPAKAFDPMEPWFVAMTLGALNAQKLGLKAENGPEMILSAAAKSNKKTIGELEGFDYQFRMFDSLPEKQQIAYLESSLESMPKLPKMMNAMVADWSSGNVEGLAKMLNDAADDDPAIYDMLLAKRNANWADWIDKRLDQPGTVFVAVGAGHLAGKTSVQDYLKKRGIESARVPQ